MCGQALSHCVNFTFRDIVKHWKGDLSRLELLEDGRALQMSNIFCSLKAVFEMLGGSCVTGFDNVGKRLIDEMRNLGVTISTTATAFPNLEDLSEEYEVRLRGHQINVIHRK